MSTRTVKYRHKATIPTITDEYTKALLHFNESTTKDECGNTWTADSGLALGNSNGKFDKYQISCSCKCK